MHRELKKSRARARDKERAFEFFPGRGEGSVCFTYSPPSQNKEEERELEKQRALVKFKVVFSGPLERDGVDASALKPTCSTEQRTESQVYQRSRGNWGC